jgi:hypothetical protein
MRWPALLTVLLLAACAADKPKPTPLETYTPKIAARQVWELRMGGLGSGLGFGGLGYPMGAHRARWRAVCGLG